MKKNSKLITAAYIGISLGCIIIALFLIAMDSEGPWAAMIALIPAFLLPLMLSTTSQSVSGCSSKHTDTLD